MESTELYQARLKSLKETLVGFQESLEIESSKFDPITQDTIRNGHVKKFKYCIELLCKVMKQNLFLYDGIDERSPKGVIKAFYRTKEISEEQYESLISMIDHRNQLSHVYNEDEFLRLYHFLPEHLKTMSEVVVKL